MDGWMDGQINTLLSRKYQTYIHSYIHIYTLYLIYIPKLRILLNCCFPIHRKADQGPAFRGREGGSTRRRVSSEEGVHHEASKCRGPK